MRRVAGIRSTSSGLDDRQPLADHRLAVLVRHGVRTETHQQDAILRDQPLAGDLLAADLGDLEGDLSRLVPLAARGAGRGGRAASGAAEAATTPAVAFGTDRSPWPAPARRRLVDVREIGPVEKNLTSSWMYCAGAAGFRRFHSHLKVTFEVVDSGLFHSPRSTSSHRRTPRPEGRPSVAAGLGRRLGRRPSAHAMHGEDLRVLEHHLDEDALIELAAGDGRGRAGADRLGLRLDRSVVAVPGHLGDELCGWPACVMWAGGRTRR